MRNFFTKYKIFCLKSGKFVQKLKKIPKTQGRISKNLKFPANPLPYTCRKSVQKNNPVLIITTSYGNMKHNGTQNVYHKGYLVIYLNLLSICLFQKRPPKLSVWRWVGEEKLNLVPECDSSMPNTTKAYCKILQLFNFRWNNKAKAVPSSGHTYRW